MNLPNTPGWRLLVAAAALALLASACGNSSTPPTRSGSSSAHAAPAASLNVELDWVPNPDHAGFYYAQNKGYFSTQNLTVNFRVPSSAADPLKLSGLTRPTLRSPTSQRCSTASRRACRS